MPCSAHVCRHTRLRVSTVTETQEQTPCGAECTRARCMGTGGPWPLGRTHMLVSTGGPREEQPSDCWVCLPLSLSSAGPRPAGATR